MSHCRFQNTLHDLNEVWRHLEHGGSVESKAEARARYRLYESCEAIIALVKENSDLRNEILNGTLRDEDDNVIDEDGNRLDEDGKIIPENE